jgi:type 1 glutamine amidotransferase
MVTSCWTICEWSERQRHVWSREYGNFRSFYTALGHSAEVFEDAGVKKHITGALLWAVRREHWLK